MAWELKYILIAFLYFVCGAFNEWGLNHRSLVNRDQPMWVYVGCAWFMVSTPAVLLLWILGA